MQAYIKYILAICLLLLLNAVGAQTPEIIWEQINGGNGDDRPVQIINTIDSGLLIIGHTNSIDGDLSEPIGLIDYWVTKLDSNGNLLWEASYGGSNYDYGQSVCLGHDGGYVLAGYTYSTDGDVSELIGGADYWIVKINEFGLMEWEKSYGGTSSDIGKYIIPTQDGGYAIIGDSKSTDGMVSGHHGTEDKFDFWIVKIDINGNVLWENSFGSTDDEKGDEIIQLSTGEFIGVGVSRGYDGDVLSNNGGADGWVIKLDVNGNLIWSNNYGGTQSEFDLSITTDSNDNLFIAGSTQSSNIIVPGNFGSYDIFILSLNPEGLVLWTKNYGGSGADNYAKIGGRNANEFIISTSSTSDDYNVLSNNGNNDFWIFAIDTLGQIKWTKSLGGSNEDLAKSVVISATNCIYVSGYSNSNDFDINPEPDYGIFNYWTVKLDNCELNLYADVDGDGFGDITNDSTACNIPIGYVTDSTDCDDTNPAIHPTLTDICNTIDDNCNGITDEDAIFVTYFLDNDGDLFGDELMDSISCNILIGYVENNLDCNDANPEINPTALEICNGIDDNCNSDIDEGLTINTLYADADGDTYGNPDAAVDTCIESIFGYVTNSLDCNDTLATIYPGATELCNYLDDDCDALVDDNVTFILSYQDADSDNFGNTLIDSISCELPTGFVLDNTDCDDTNPDIYPGAVEVLNGLDDDCDQMADEGLAIKDIVKNTISIYPNPATNILFIQSNANYTITILNQLGEEIQHSKLLIGLNTIDVADFVSGVYWVQVENGEMVVWVKE